jgi:hypothetical protein
MPAKNAHIPTGGKMPSGWDMWKKADLVMIHANG